MDRNSSRKGQIAPAAARGARDRAEYSGDGSCDGEVRFFFFFKSDLDGSISSCVEYSGFRACLRSKIDSDRHDTLKMSVI